MRPRAEWMHRPKELGRELLRLPLPTAPSCPVAGLASSQPALAAVRSLLQLAAMWHSLFF